MTRSLQLELNKVRPKLFVRTLLIGAVVIAMGSVGFAITGAEQVELGLISAEDATRDVAISGFAGLLFATLLGAYLMTGEVKSRTLAHTYLLTPQRQRVLSSKAVVSVLLGAIVGIASVAVAVTSAYVVFAQNGISPVWTSDIILRLIGVVVVTMAAGPWGVAIGAIVKNGMVATIGIVVYTTMIETVFVEFLPSIGRFTLGGLQGAVIGDTSFAERLSPAVGSVLMALFIGAGFAAAVTYVRSTEVAV